MILVFVLTALIISVADARSQNDVEVNREAKFLPKDPMVIQLSKDDHYRNDPPRITYRGCHKFCVGTFGGNPSSAGSDPVWNPYNQSSEEIYYFRYVQVDMKACRWPLEAVNSQILELFFDRSDDRYNVYNEDNEGYIISLPAKVTWHSFYFLIYNPDSQPDYNFKVRWTSYMNACNTSDTAAPIDTHYEPDSFDPADYVSVFQDII